MKNEFLMFRIIFWIVVIFLLVFSTGCVNLPTRYNDLVVITRGPHKNKRGRLIGDCPGFEMYQVDIGYKVCVRSWHMELL